VAVVTAVLASALLFGSVSDSPEDQNASDETEVAMLSPHAYLWAQYPTLAARFDCVIQRESGWTPWARNPRSGAAGLTQIIASTWAGTPQGKAGESRLDPYANLDAAAWLVLYPYANLDAAAWLVLYGGGWRHWAATVGGCPR
jgi:hypothetical protein